MGENRAKLDGQSEPSPLYYFYVLASGLFIRAGIITFIFPSERNLLLQCEPHKFMTYTRGNICKAVNMMEISSKDPSKEKENKLFRNSLELLHIFYCLLYIY